MQLADIAQRYLATNQSSGFDLESADLGASVAEHYGKMVGPVQRQLSKSLALYFSSQDANTLTHSSFIVRIVQLPHRWRQEPSQSACQQVLLCR